MTCFFLRASAVLGYWRGGGRRRSVGYIMRISPKTILTTGEDRRSLSHAILDMYNFYRDESAAAWILPTNWPVRILPKNRLGSHRIVENIILTTKSRNLNRKKICPPICMKCSHCDCATHFTLLFTIESRRLFHENFFFQLTKQECSFDVNMLDLHLLLTGNC